MTTATKCRAKDPAACMDPNCPERKAFYEEFGFTFAKDVPHGVPAVRFYEVDLTETDAAAAFAVVETGLRDIYQGCPALLRFVTTGQLEAHRALDELAAADNRLIASSPQRMVDGQNLLKLWVNEVIVAQGGSARVVSESVLPKPTPLGEARARNEAKERSSGYRWGYDKTTGDYNFGMKR